MLDNNNNNNNNTSTTTAGNAIRAAKQRQSSKVELRHQISKLDDNIRTSRQDLRRLKGESKSSWKKRVKATLALGQMAQKQSGSSGGVGNGKKEGSLLSSTTMEYNASGNAAAASAT